MRSLTLKKRAIALKQRCLSSAPSRWRSEPVPELHDGTVAYFRSHSWLDQVPVLLPRGHFSDLPAVQRWFQLTHNEHFTAGLNRAYFKRHEGVVVPLELTRLLNDGTSTEGGSMFERFNAPLRLFLQWIEAADHLTTDRLYLAQASISDLPQQFRDDLPTPELVTKAGHGDIYDANIWIGLSPTYTPLHKDPNPNLFVQMAGSKVVRIFPPDQGLRVFHRVQRELGRSSSPSFRGSEMMAGAEKLKLEAEVWGEDGSHPEDGPLTWYEASLQAGDGLFIPQGWWHSIKGVGQGVTGSVNWWFR